MQKILHRIKALCLQLTQRSRWWKSNKMAPIHGIITSQKWTIEMQIFFLASSLEMGSQEGKLHNQVW
jgi:hypothetical protein